jgi:hypothetical protein
MLTPKIKNYQSCYFAPSRLLVPIRRRRVILSSLRRRNLPKAVSALTAPTRTLLVLLIPFREGPVPPESPFTRFPQCDGNWAVGFGSARRPFLAVSSLQESSFCCMRRSLMPLLWSSCGAIMQRGLLFGGVGRFQQELDIDLGL